MATTKGLSEEARNQLQLLGITDEMVDVLSLWEIMAGFDASTSMTWGLQPGSNTPAPDGSSRWDNLCETLPPFLKVLTLIDEDGVESFAWNSRIVDLGTLKTDDVDPAMPKIKQIIKLGGGTNFAACFREIAKRSQSSDNDRVAALIITDGEPSGGEDGKIQAIEAAYEIATNPDVVGTKEDPKLRVLILGVGPESGKERDGVERFFSVLDEQIQALGDKRGKKALDFIDCKWFGVVAEGDQEALMRVFFEWLHG